MTIDPSITAGVITILGSGALAAAVSKFFDRKKDEASAGKTIQETYSALVADLKQALADQEEKTQRLLDEERKRCDERMAAIEAHMEAKMAQMHNELARLKKLT
jgi:uncharacterized protein YlxW (UPF0749 family)